MARSEGSDSLPAHGPLLIASRAEVERIYDFIRYCPSTDVHAMTLLSKCEAVLNADPRFRKPIK